MFNELESVEKLVIDCLSDVSDATISSIHERPSWKYIPSDLIERQKSDIIVEKVLAESLMKINPEYISNLDRADEVIYHLRAIMQGVTTDGLVRANENFTQWLRGERSMPFGHHNEHAPIKLIDFDDISKNEFTITSQWIYPSIENGKRLDIVFLVNGIPLVIGEVKTPVRPSISWMDGASDIVNGYQLTIPQMFVPNVFSFSTEGKHFRYGSVRMPIDLWGPWYQHGIASEGSLSDVKRTITSMLQPEVVLDFLRYYTLYATDRKHRRIKIIARYQQYEGANLIVDRVVKGMPNKGLIWHFQGSGKSLLMVFAASKLRMHPHLKNPTVIIVVDRVDLDTQITATFNATEIPNLISTESCESLKTLLANDMRKIIITTIYKFAETDTVLNTRKNIIVMVDEAHRTQEGNLGRQMRHALPNAFLFGLTGTPINKNNRNTFWAFGAEEDNQGYLSRYSFEESIRDNATLPLHFEAVDVKLHIDKEAIDEAYGQLTSSLSDDDKDDLAKRAARMAILIKSPERVATICQHIVNHYQSKVEPNGFKAQVVAFDRECCVLYKREFDKIWGDDASAIVMHTSGGKSDEYAEFKLSKDEEEKLLERYRDPSDPLRLLVVTSKLLTGFDAPILQAMYLDKPMRDHNLLQAICRTNRPYPNKTHGLIIDYLGIFDDVAKALNFDENSVLRVITNIELMKHKLGAQVNKCLAFFPNIDRTIGGYEGLIAAQECLPSNEVKDHFAAEYSVLSRIWESISPDSILSNYQSDYKWLSQVFESVRPASGTGRLLWHALGAKTIELVHENVHIEAVHDDLDTLVMNDEVLKGLLSSADQKTKAKEIELKLLARLRKHSGISEFIALGERLDQLKNKHEQGLINSLDFLKMLLDLAKDVLVAEKKVDTEDERLKAKTALTELFSEIKHDKTPVFIERIVADIDEVVRVVRFPGWQETKSGVREVQKALRKIIYIKYQIEDQDLFEKACVYVKQYY